MPWSSLHLARDLPACNAVPRSAASTIWFSYQHCCVHCLQPIAKLKILFDLF
jgi:hypothetical protein